MLGARNHPPSVARCRRTAEHGFPGGLTERLAEPCIHRPRVLVAHQVQASRQRTDLRSAPGQPADRVTYRYTRRLHREAISSAGSTTRPSRVQLRGASALLIGLMFLPMTAPGRCTEPDRCQGRGPLRPRVPIVGGQALMVLGLLALALAPNDLAAPIRPPHPRSLIRLGSRGSADSRLSPRSQVADGSGLA